MSTITRTEPKRSSVLPEEEGRKLFDQQARLLADMSGDEFIERWDRGEFRPLSDTPDGRKKSYLALLIPFGRRKS